MKQKSGLRKNIYLVSLKTLRYCLGKRHNLSSKNIVDKIIVFNCRPFKILTVREFKAEN